MISKSKDQKFCDKKKVYCEKNLDRHRTAECGHLAVGGSLFSVINSDVLVGILRYEFIWRYRCRVASLMAPSRVNWRFIWRLKLGSGHGQQAGDDEENNLQEIWRFEISFLTLESVEWYHTIVYYTFNFATRTNRDSPLISFLSGDWQVFERVFKKVWFLSFFWQNAKWIDEIRKIWGRFYTKSRLVRLSPKRERERF